MTDSMRQPRDENGQFVSLREYIERILDEREKATEAARKSMELRLDRLNELRAEVQEDRGQYLTRDKYDGEHDALSNRISLLESWRGKAALVMAGVAVVAGLIGAAIMRLLTGFFGAGSP